MGLKLLSKRSELIPPSPIRKLAPLARAAEARGQKVFHLNIGQPDIQTPQEFLDALKSYQKPVVAYDSSEGSSELRSAWSRFMNHSLDLHTDPEQFQITTGASEALIFSFLICCDPGDEVIVFDPSYANYISFAVSCGVKLAPVLCSIENNFALPPVNKINDKTKAILLCNPNNPTGTVYTKAELQFLLELCEEENLFLIVDEAYREFVYDGQKPFSVFHLDPSHERVILIDSLSKRFSLCGARLGALISANQEVLAASLKIAQARLSCPAVDQFAAAQMLKTISPSFINSIQAEYQKRRNTLFDAFGKIPGVTLKKPQGAFYAIVRLPVPDADDFARFMLKDFSSANKTTFVAPAQGFYLSPNQGKDEARVAYVLNSEDLKSAIELLALGLQAYRPKPVPRELQLTR